MKNIVILKSKLSMPEPPKAFRVTERLENLHKQMDSHQVVMICAPAGYGKTTLAASYLKRKRALADRVCWYRLESEDRHPSVFIAHLIESLFPFDSPEFSETRKSIDGYVNAQAQPHHTLAVLCQEMWAHYTSGRKIYIALDDFHNVADNEDIHNMTSFLIENLPSSINVIILSRIHPTILSEKQKLDKRTQEINRDHLLLDSEEIETMMSDIQLSQQALHKIQESTEGWAAGIAIVYQAARQTKDASFVGLNQSEPKEALFRYMSEEVYKSIDTDIQNILAKLSLFKEFSELDAYHVFGVKDINTIMDKCISSGMFIQRLGGNPVGYHFHSLFREFLQQMLHKQISAEVLEQTYLEITKYYLSTKQYARAADYLSLFNNAELVLELVMSESTRLLMLGNPEQSEILLNMLPEKIIWNNEVALMIKAMILPYERHEEMEYLLTRCISLSLSSGNSMILIYAAVILLLYYWHINAMDKVSKTLSLVPEQLTASGPETAHIAPFFNLAGLISQDKFSNIAEGHQDANYLELIKDIQWIYLIQKSTSYSCLGRLEEAENCIDQAFALDVVSQIDIPRAHVLICQANISLLKNEKARLSNQILEMANIGEKYDLAATLSHVKHLAAYEKYLSYETQAAVEQLEYASYYYEKYGDRGSSAYCRLLRSLWLPGRASAEHNLDQAKQDLAIIKQLKAGRLIYESSQIILATLAGQAGGALLAERTFASALRSCQAKGAEQIICSLLFHRADMYFTAGKLDKAKNDLHSAMDLAHVGKYLMYREISIPVLTRMVLCAIHYSYYADFCGDILARFYNSTTVRYLTGMAKILDEGGIPAFVEKFLSAYKQEDEEQLYYVKASLFGSPDFFVNGVAIPDTEWKTKKIRGLLEFLLLYNNKPVSKEALMEILWPDSDNKSAMVSMRTALYQLRKTLSKFNIEVSGSKALLYETLDGLRIRSESVETDIDEFVRLDAEFNMIAKQASAGRDAEQMQVLSKMVTLYRGDLLEGNDYGELFLIERERFKRIFIKTCRVLSSLYIKDQRWQEAEQILKRVLLSDPYNEASCLDLVRLFITGGRRGEAVQLYKRFKKRFEQDLNIKVDSRLSEAIKSM